MSKVFKILKKDLLTFFFTPQAAVITAGFFLLAAYFFLNYLGNFNLALQKAANQTYLGMEKINLNQWVAENYYLTLTLANLILIPIIITRGIVEERRSGTLDLLFTYPISSFQIALGKYLGALVPLIILHGVAGLLPFGLILIANPELSLMISGYCALLLSTAGLVALSIAAAAFCSNPLSAGFTAFLLLAFLFSLQLLGSNGTLVISDFAQAISPFTQAKYLIKGQVYFTALYYHFAILAFGIFLLWQIINLARSSK